MAHRARQRVLNGSLSTPARAEWPIEHASACSMGHRVPQRRTQLRPAELSHSLATVSASFLSDTTSLTSLASVGVSSLAETAFSASVAFESTPALYTSGTTFCAPNRPFGSSRTTK